MMAPSARRNPSPTRSRPSPPTVNQTNRPFRNLEEKSLRKTTFNQSPQPWLPLAMRPLNPEYNDP
jgi:hypothetical protein